MPDLGLSKDSLRNIVSLTGEFVGTTDTQELQNKTISTLTNILTSSGIQTGDILKGYTNDHYGRLARGSANQVLIAGASDINWGTLQPVGGGTGATTLTGVVIGNGTSAFTTKSNPAGAFLGDSDTQNVTGPKSFLNQMFKLRNPANTQVLTFQNPAITSSQEYRFNSQYAYYIFKDGSTYYAKSGTTKGIESSSADASTVIQYAVTAVLASSFGGTILFSADLFTIETPIDIPTSTAPKQIVFRGQPSHTRNRGTQLEVGTTFPTNRYIFETSGATDGSLKWAVCYFYDLQAFNLNYATINAGFVKFESDQASYYRTLVCERLWMQYLWRGIHMLGAVWWPYVNDIRFHDANASFIGDADIKTEYNAHTTLGVNAWPKAANISNIMSFHALGTMKNALAAIDLGYSDIQAWHVDGTKYTEALFAFTGNCHYNVIRHIQGSDTVAPTPDVRKAALYLNGTSATGNKFYDVHLPKYPDTLAVNGGATYNHVELAAYWGSAATINDTGAGVGNVVVVNPGAQSGTVIKVTTTAGLVRMIDLRNGAYNTGVSTQSGNATTAAFNIAHGLYTTPLTYSVQAQTNDAVGPPTITATSTNLVVTYPVAPPTGSSNLIWVWTAGVY